METDPTQALDVRPTKEEGELSEQDKDSVTAELEKVLSEEQTYGETVRGMRSYIGWSHIPDFDNSLSSSNDNPFATLSRQDLYELTHQRMALQKNRQT